MNNNSFKTWLYSYYKYVHIYEKIKPKIFDVSLRDGIQRCQDLQKYSTQNKKNIYKSIIHNYDPKYIEIGSFINPKILPIMQDSLELFKNIHDESQNQDEDKNQINVNLNPDIFLLIPSLKKMHEMQQNHPDIFSICNNFSLITSVSDEFQKKNINKSLIETKNEIKDIIHFLRENKTKNKIYIKLYISCINECPITGKIDNDYIVNELLEYTMKYNINNLCLSDTCGTLRLKDFEYIIDRCILYGIPNDIISVHLHYNYNDTKERKRVKEIIYSSFNRKINLFDISLFNEGGSITMKRENLKSNLTYELFYELLMDYIIKECNNQTMSKSENESESESQVK